MRLRLTLYCLLLFSIHTGYTQRLSTGFNLAFCGYHRTTLPDNFIFPPHSYFIYYTANEKEGLPIHNQKFNGLFGGLNLSLDYKRWMLTAEINFGSTSIKIPTLYPSPLGELLDNNWSTFVINKSYISFPLLISYKLTRKANGPFLIGGAQYGLYSFKEDNHDLDSDISDGVSLFLADTEMYGVIYNEWNYASLIAGVGLKKNNNYYSVRYTQRLNIATEKFPMAKFFQFDVVWSKSLNFQKLKKGYHIYLE